jgi:hypothetical protein
MTAAECAAFDRSLSHEERERVTNDIQLEAEIGDVLNARVACPKPAWKAALSGVRQERRAARRNIHGLRRNLWVGIPLAACLVIVVLALVPEHRHAEPSFLALREQDISSVAAKSQVSDGVTGVRAFMEQRSLPVALNPADALDGETTPYRLIGAREDQFYGERVVQLFFDCDGEPGILVIAQNAGLVAGEIGQALAKGKVRACRSFGGVVVAVVGANAPRDLIQVVSDHWPSAEETAGQTPEETPQEEAAPAEDSVRDALAAPVSEPLQDVLEPTAPDVTDPTRAPEAPFAPEMLREVAATLV